MWPWRTGSKGILVSTHGGRQLDMTMGAIEMVPEIVEASRGQAEVYVDSGVRRGSDVIKALALGAKAVAIGRPLFWGLAMDGADGVHGVLELLREEDLARSGLLWSDGCQQTWSRASSRFPPAGGPSAAPPRRRVCDKPERLPDGSLVAIMDKGGTHPPLSGFQPVISQRACPVDMPYPARFLPVFSSYSCQVRSLKG